MNKYSNIFLIGPMGAGKSTVGKELSSHLEMDFYDSDNEIVKYSGLDVKEIFNREGEVGFRKIEEIIIEKLTKREGIIISTGGGTILSQQNRNILMKRGIVIYLKVSIYQQVKRTNKDIDRPLLHEIIICKNQNKNNINRLKILYKERNNIYHKMSDFMIYTEGSSIYDIVRYICDNLR